MAKATTITAVVESIRHSQPVEDFLKEVPQFVVAESALQTEEESRSARTRKLDLHNFYIWASLGDETGWWGRPDRSSNPRLMMDDGSEQNDTIAIQLEPDMAKQRNGALVPVVKDINQTWPCGRRNSEIPNKGGRIRGKCKDSIQ